MNKIRVFLCCLMFCWFLGFLYMFSSSSDSWQKHKVDRKRSGEALAEVEYYEVNKDDGAVKLNFKKLISELHELELKNKHNEDTIAKLRKVANTLVTKNSRNDRLEPIEQNEQIINDKSTWIETNDKPPSLQYEQTRRKLFEDIKDLKYYLNSQLKHGKIFKDENSEDMDYFKGMINDRIDLLLVEMYNLSTTNDFGKWRQSESQKLSDRIQERFHKMQNPKDCGAAKKLLCNLNKSCGYGCQIHHVVYCFITAFFTNRTMVLQSENWHYDQRGFTAYFEPISDSCTSLNGEEFVDWNQLVFSRGAVKLNFDDTKNVKLPIVDTLMSKPAFLPLSIPKEFHKEMELFHGDPFVWWVGQILKYLTQFNDAFKETVADKTKEIKFRNSCVGVHVRRTDKVGTEAAFHDIKEYMTEVEKYYNTKQMAADMLGQKVEKCVFLASDDTVVLTEAKKKYPDYEFIYMMQNAKQASLEQRYTSAQGIILDIYFLSQCEYLVCTFSSQVCRMAYEYMQTRFPDASWRFKSLDDVYYYGGGNGHHVVARFDHTPRRGSGEIYLEIGDQVALAGNHWNGFSKGKNVRTGKVGLFPSFKVKDIVTVY